MDTELLLITGRSATGHCCQLCSFLDLLLDYCWLSPIWIVYGNNGEEAVNRWRRWLHWGLVRQCGLFWWHHQGCRHWRTHDKWVDRFGTRYQRSNMRCWEKTYHQLTVLVIWHLGLLLIAKHVNEDECRMWIRVTALTGCVWTNQAQ